MRDDFIHIGDFKRFFKRKKKSIITLGIASAFTTMMVCFIIEPKYILQASFKEATMRAESSSSSMLRTLLKSPGSVDLGTQALGIMKSRQLIQRVVEEMGLQGNIKNSSLKNKLTKRCFVNYRLAIGKIVDNTPFYKVKTVSYLGKEQKKIDLHWVSKDRIEVYSSEGEFLCEQDPKEVFILPDVKFSLEINVEGFSSGRDLLVIDPMQITIDKVISKLKVKVRREDPNFLDLSYIDIDPKRGACLLNLLMQEYKSYLVKENDRIARAQLEYLTTRQGEIADKLDETLKYHVEYLQTTLGDKGFMGLHQEIEMMESKKKRHQQRLLEIDLDINKLSRIKAKKLFLLQDSFLGQEVTPMQHMLLGLKKQKDGLDLAVMKRISSFSKQAKKEHPILRFNTSRETINNLENTLDILETSNHLLPVFANLKNQLQNLYLEKDINNLDKIEWINNLKHEMQKDLLLVPSEQKNSVMHKIHLLNLRKTILKERLEKEIAVPRELEGIDLETAKTLHVQYVHELDESRLKKRELQFAFDRIEEESFEISSITDLVRDVITQDIVKETTQLSSELKNERYLSDKDRLRLKQQLSRKKEMFKIHLQQKMYLLDLRLQLIEEKIIILQQIISDLVNQEIAIVEEQIDSMLKEKIEASDIERKAINKKLQELQIEMKSIPRKWLIENRLQLQSDLNVGIMEGMSQLVESKNVEHHLLQVESKSIDEAYIPLKPIQRSLILYSLLGGCLGALITMGVSVGKRVTKGFPISLEGLNSRRLQIAGPFLHKPSFQDLNTLKKEDLEILREVVRVLLEDKVSIASAILNGMPNYTYILGQLLVLSGKKILLIDLTFSPTKEKGILEYLMGKTKDILINQQEQVHKILLGCDNTYIVELLSTIKFRQLLQDVESSYDIILIVTDKKVNSSEARKLSEFSQKMIITLDEESLDDLYPYNQLKKTPLYLAFE